MVGMIAAAKTLQLAVSGLKDMVNNVVELDKSITELQKVSDLSGASLKSYVADAYANAELVGRTGKELVDAATNFKRSGVDINDTLDMGNAALIMTNVADGIDDVSEASSVLISILRAFDIDNSDILSIVDKMNEVSNNSPISFDDISDSLKRVSGTLAQTGTSIDETIGLITGGFATLRNSEIVSSGIMMISQRLRGIDEDGQAIDGLVPKLQKDFKDIANIDIQDSDGNLRSTYDILADMAKVFPTLSTKQQQYLGELAAG